jgi:hypothetical protein
VDVVAATTWAAGLAAATGALSGALGERLAAADPRGLAAGAVVAGIVAVAGAHTRQARYLPYDTDE